MKPGDGFQMKTSLLLPLVCGWQSLHIWCIYLPCIRLYLCSKLVLSLITAGSSTHRSVIFISSSKEWSSLNWEGKHTQKNNGSSNDYLFMHSTTATLQHFSNFSLFQARWSDDMTDQCPLDGSKLAVQVFAPLESGSTGSGTSSSVQIFLAMTAQYHPIT